MKINRINTTQTLLGALFALALTATGATAQVNGNAVDRCAMLQAINQQRSNNGLSALTWNTKLEQAAYDHTAWMNQDLTNRFDHTGSGGSQPWDRAQSAGYSWNRVTENIAAGQTTTSEVMTSWMNSTGHRANILDKDVTEVGVARINNTWTQVFGRPPSGGTSDGTYDACSGNTGGGNTGQQGWQQQLATGDSYWQYFANRGEYNYGYAYYYYFYYVGYAEYYGSQGFQNYYNGYLYCGYALFYYYYFAQLGDNQSGTYYYNYFAGIAGQYLG